MERPSERISGDSISSLQGKFKPPKCKVLDQLDFKDILEKMHANFVLVPPDKAANNVIVVCKKYHIETSVKELGINTTSKTSSTYIPFRESFDEIIKTHANFINSQLSILTIFSGLAALLSVDIA